MHETLSVEWHGEAGGPLQHRPFLHLLLHCDRPLVPGARWALEGLDQLELGRAAGDAVDRPGRLADQRVSSRHAVLRKASGGWEVEDLASKNGTFVNGRRVTREPLRDGDLLELGHSFLLFRDRCPAPSGLPRSTRARATALAPGLGTLMPALAERFAQLAKVAPTRIPILVTGETGTGKEVVASAIHELSGRPGPFVAVNCGAIARNLAESELFGYRKGAFSGALEDRAGLVRSSDGGTLFLDEFAELPAEARTTLLRVLQESEVLPVGGTRPVPVDLRLVVATHRDLEAMVAAGEFRADLLARVGGFRLTLPPLRERREDLGALVAELLIRHAPQRHDVALRPDAARALLHHDWPLNVRELEKALATALALAAGGLIELAHLPAEVVRGPLQTPAPPTPPPAPLTDQEQEQKGRLVEALQANQGNVTAAAQALGEYRTQVHRWLKRYGIDPDQFRG
jgi:DNA-binding NtrC family response regulator